MARLDTLAAALTAAGIDYSCGELLAGHCTFRIGGAADVFVRPRGESELCKAIKLCMDSETKYFLLGNGSNILFSDEGFHGAVIDVSAMSSELLLDGNVITASAGCTLMQLCRFAQKNQLAGLEFAYGIPGTVGGAVYMNAGAYGGEMKDVVRDVTLLQKDGHIAKLSGSEMQFRYRHSILEDSGACVLHVCFALAPGDEKMISARMEELMARRREKQPLDKPSAGSTFKRPEGAFAAALIEQCGLRGYRVGGAAISEKHCGFVVNLGGASCADVLCLCRDVTEAVKGKTGYALEKEVRVVGD